MNVSDYAYSLPEELIANRPPEVRGTSRQSGDVEDRKYADLPDIPESGDVLAFVGWGHLSTAYAHAVEQKYQFLSYGDSMLIM